MDAQIARAFEKKTFTGLLLFFSLVFGIQPRPVSVFIEEVFVLVEDKSNSTAMEGNFVSVAAIVLCWVFYLNVHSN